MITEKHIEGVRVYCEMVSAAREEYLNESRKAACKRDTEAQLMPATERYMNIRKLAFAEYNRIVRGN